MIDTHWILLQLGKDGDNSALPCIVWGWVKIVETQPIKQRAVLHHITRKMDSSSFSCLSFTQTVSLVLQASSAAMWWAHLLSKFSAYNKIRKSPPISLLLKKKIIIKLNYCVCIFLIVPLRFPSRRNCKASPKHNHETPWTWDVCSFLPSWRYLQSDG